MVFVVVVFVVDVIARNVEEGATCDFGIFCKVEHGSNDGETMVILEPLSCFYAIIRQIDALVRCANVCYIT